MQATDAHTTGTSALPRAVTMDSLVALDERITALVESIKDEVYKPEKLKPAPTFNAAQLASLCRKTRASMLRLLEKAEVMGLADGIVQDGDKQAGQRRFTLEQTIEWVRAQDGLRYVRKSGQRGAVLTVGFFKGGVGKTTLAMSLAQGLSLKGYKVLCIDLDPQGSLTAFLGKNPANVDIEETFAPVAFLPDQDLYRSSLAESIRPTYWSGIDLIAASTGLFQCEFYLPLRTMKLSPGMPGFNFLELMDNALNKGIRDEYDYIIIDTPPALSYVTMNAYWAADAVVMPLMPDGLSLQSSVQFWNQFTELAMTASQLAGRPKEYAWLGIVPNQVESHKPNQQEMQKWIRLGYGEYVLNTSIPKTEAIKTGTYEYNSVYDISKYVGNQKTYERAREALDELVEEVDGLTRRNFWLEPASLETEA